MSAGLRAEIVVDLDGLEALVPAWWELWRRAPAATPFASPAWLVPWWRVFVPGRLATVAVFHGDRILALAPAYVETGPLGRRLLPLGIGISDYLDILLAPEDGPAVLPLLAQAVEALDGIDAWELEELPPGAAAWSLPTPDAFSDISGDHSACPVLVVSGQDGLDHVPARQRRKLRMAHHRAARRGGTVRRVDPGGVTAFLGDLSRLHLARWQARGEGGVLGPEVLRFHEAALPELASAGLADLLTLTIEGRVVGAYYGLAQPGRAYAYLGGFDPDFAFESPGTVLLGRAIADAAARGAGELHLLRGQEGYKYAWGAVDRRNRRRSLTRLDPA